MIFDYLPYVILLAISPVAGKYFLRFAYPDVKTYVKERKWALFAAFGFSAYVPAVFLTLFEIVMPLYSPLTASPVFDYEGNSIVAIILFFGILVLNTSIIDFVVTKRKKTTVVGIPKHVIKYSIGKQIVETKKEKRGKEITKITQDLENVISAEKEEKDLTALLESIRSTMQATATLPEKVAPSELEILKGPIGEPLSPEESEKFKSGLESLESLDESSKKLIGYRKLPSLKREALPAKKQEERERLIAELEEKLKHVNKDDKEKLEKADKLMEELKRRIKEDREEASKGEEVYVKSDIEDITRALKEMKAGEVAESARKEHRHGREKEPEEDLGESLLAYEKTYKSRRGEDDVWRAVAGDVRQQLTETRGETRGRARGEVPKGPRWYDKGIEQKGVEAPAEQPENVELFEGDMLQGGEELGEGLGELGEGLGELGDISDLENITQGLDSSEFDGMFVDMGETKGRCPNCGKKGTSVVYCSNCGKPLCSNCSKSVEGSESFIKYKCPHCEEEFAMKRRIPA